MAECEQCGVGSRGAFLLEDGDRTLCTDCAAPGECKRCGRGTDETTLSGDWLCGDCQNQRGEQYDTREDGQAALGEFGD